jgi:thiamine biosynthesis lipoprotein
MRTRCLFPIVIIWLVSLFIFPLHCSDALLKQSRSLLGTVVEITTLSPDESRARRGMDAVFQEISRIEELMSFYRPESQVSQINRDVPPHRVRVSPEVFALLKHARSLSQFTQGAFDVTFVPLWQLWGRCAKERRLPSAGELQQAKALVDYRKLRLWEETQEVGLDLGGMQVNLGGIAKGYALARAAEVMQQEGLDNFLVNMGGDICAQGGGKEGKGWRVGIRHPRREGDFIGILRLRDMFVMTSGDYERFFEIRGERYHHILDCRSGYPASVCSQVTILTRKLGREYLPSIVFFLLGPKRGLELLQGCPDLAGLIVNPEGEILHTPNLTQHLEGDLFSRVEMNPIGDR